MTDSGPTSPTKKFPYLILPNLSAEKIEGDCLHRKKEQKLHKQIVNHNKERTNAGIAGAGGFNFLQSSAERVSSETDGIHDQHRMSMAHHTSSAEHRLFNDLNHGQGQGASNILVAQKMKAILMAQKELRQPASSLYPNSSPSQISLIPETEMIYRKYFPSDETDIISSRKDSKKLNSLISQHSLGPHGTILDALKQKEPLGIEIATSASDSNISCLNRNSSRVLCLSMPVNDNAKLDSKCARLKDEGKFKKRVHQQLLTLNQEVEKQCSEINDLKKDMKELRNVIRRNSSEYDSAKSSIESLSKNVQEMDSKVDCLQDTVGCQEKSILSKLMLIGEMTDSDSEFEDVDTKGMDASGSSSATKINKPSSPKHSSLSGAIDCFPKGCCNWIPIAPDFDKLLQAVASLNYRMDRNQSIKLCATTSGATFKHADIVDLTLFKNGMILGSAGFRSYSTMSVIRFVNEIFNNYLPTELSTQYPEGVVIVINDKRSVVYSSEERFSGHGLKLSSIHDDIPDIIPGTNVNSVCTKRSYESPLSSTTSSLNSTPIVSTTSSVTNIASRYEFLPDLFEEKCQHAGVQKRIILKLTDETGQMYKLNVTTTATVESILDHLEKLLKTQNKEQGKNLKSKYSGSVKYDLISPVPYGKLACSSCTLLEYGITHNTLLYIRVRK